MPWVDFENTMGGLMTNHIYGEDADSWAKQFTNNYHKAMLSGGDTINKIAVQKPNKKGMENALKGYLKQVNKSDKITLLDIIGPAIITYWTGASMSIIRPPIIPAIGALVNVSTVQGRVINPGTWAPLSVPPNKDSKIFISAFKSAAIQHLSTLTGEFATLSVYPGLLVNPGVVPWFGYTVP